MTLREQLEEIVMVVRKIRKDTPHPYYCIEDFILKNGRAFTNHGPLPKGVRRGRKNQCFKNAYYLADRKGLIYVEGYASTKTLDLATLHAWCVDGEGTVIDPTWKNGDEYFGVPFSMKYVNRTIFARERFGIIDNVEEHFPLLSGKHKRFLEKKVKL